MSDEVGLTKSSPQLSEAPLSELEEGICRSQ
jgi:hypothetical protein